MAQYQSSLTGPEIDAALTDMARHDSEAWAVGTRDGEAVSSLDITYHNNAAYYANNASAAAARAESAVPAGTAGAVFFDQAQTLTDAQKRQVSVNVGLPAANPQNMIDNGWFLINQRGTTSYSTTGQFVFDRWYLYSGAVNWSADGITTNSAFILYQNYETPRFKNGEYYRVSILLSDGTIYSSRMAVDAVYHYIGGSANPYFRIRFETSGLAIRFQCLAAGAGMIVRALKIENQYTGASSLAYDMAPDISEELIKCRRYLYVIGSRSTSAHIGLGLRWNSSGQYLVNIPLPVDLYKNPTVSTLNNTVSNIMGIYQSSTGTSATSLGNYNLNGTHDLVIRPVIPGQSAAVIQVYVANSDRLVISAEL